MNISYLTYQPNIYPSSRKSTAKPSFTGGIIPEALTHVNIGSKADGFVGKIRVRIADGGEAILNVFKKRTNTNAENYKIVNDYNELIGEMDLVIKKITDYQRYDSTAKDPSHVFVDMLKNYTRPGTPDHNPNIIYHKDIGTRLLQIAQRRSDEALCNGEMRLNAKGESREWYFDVIGMKQLHPPSKSMYHFQIHNPNLLYLPAEAKEPLSRLHGGL
ncbi:hypothetical protein IJ472_04015 [bacterium]|nr:hypothetical protein [bacterium]